MKTFHPPNNFLVIFFIFVLGFIATGCSENKYSQCERLIKLANTVVAKTQAMTSTEKGQSLKLKIWLQSAEIMTIAAQQLEALPLTDPKLLQYQATLVQIYHTNSQATYNMIKAKENKDIVAAVAAQTNVKTAGEWEKKLRKGINTYCVERSQLESRQ